VRVLYVSKALHVAAYREKLRALAEHIDIRAVTPDRWNGARFEPGQPDERIAPQPVVLPGHNHFHLYASPRALLAEPVDLVHIDEEPYSAVTAQLVSACRARGIPCLFFAWQNLAKRLPPPFGLMRAYVFRAVAGGIAGTPRAAEVLRRAGFNRPLATIPQFGVDAARFAPDVPARTSVRARLGAGESDFVVGFGGRLVREKGVHVLLAAVSGLAGVRLLFLGDGPERAALVREAAHAGCAARVHFAGPVHSLEMARWLCALDALVLPSLTRSNWTEQFGRILVEAMACEVPVVGSGAGEIPHVMGSAGITVSEGDVASLRDALAMLVASPARRQTLGRLGRTRVLARFTHERVASATAEFYRTLLPERSPAWARER